MLSHFQYQCHNTSYVKKLVIKQTNTQKSELATKMVNDKTDSMNRQQIKLKFLQSVCNVT